MKRMYDFEDWHRAASEELKNACFVNGPASVGLLKSARKFAESALECAQNPMQVALEQGLMETIEKVRHVCTDC